MISHRNKAKVPVFHYLYLGNGAGVEQSRIGKTRLPCPGDTPAMSKGALAG